MRFLLDTDILTAALNGVPRVEARIKRVEPGELWVSGVAAQEMLHGTLAMINGELSRPRGGIEAHYELLARVIRHLSHFDILPYSDAAESIYRHFPAGVKRIGTADCRTGALALQHGLTVVTRNVRHFQQIPGLSVEDWTV